MPGHRFTYNQPAKRLPLWILFLLIFGSHFVNAAPKNSCPPGGTYVDRGTGRTECCSDFCKNAEIMMSQEECDRNCPDYKIKVGSSIGEDKQPEKATRRGNVLQYVIPIVAVLVLAVLVSAFIFYLKKRNTNANDDAPRNGQQPELLSQGADLHQQDGQDGGDRCDNEAQQPLNPPCQAVNHPIRVSETGANADHAGDHQTALMQLAHCD